MKKVIITILVIICIAFCSTRVYEVEPYQNCNGWVAGDPLHGIGQTFVAICDSFVWVDIFIGTPSLTGRYIFEIVTSPGNAPVYEGWATVPTNGYQYVRSESLIKYGN